MTRKSAPTPPAPAAPALLPATGGSFVLIDGQLVPEKASETLPDPAPETGVQTPVEGGL